MKNIQWLYNGVLSDNQSEISVSDIDMITLINKRAKRLFRGKGYDDILECINWACFEIEFDYYKTVMSVDRLREVFKDFENGISIDNIVDNNFNWIAHFERIKKYPYKYYRENYIYFMNAIKKLYENDNEAYIYIKNILQLSDRKGIEYYKFVYIGNAIQRYLSSSNWKSLQKSLGNLVFMTEW